jgi:hypothetical protein
MLMTGIVLVGLGGSPTAKSGGGREDEYQAE